MSIRKIYDRDLKTLNSDLVLMASKGETAIRQSIKALIEHDEALAKEVIENDKVIDELEKSIERQCLKLLLKEQPVANDLRNISTALKMITDVERIGDQAADISEIGLKIMNEEYYKKLEHIPIMSELVIEMVSSSVHAFVNRDIDLAKKVIKSDDEVDDMFYEVKNEIVGYIQKDSSVAEQSIYFMMIAKYLERIGDHAVNIADWVIFNITGIHTQK